MANITTVCEVNNVQYLDVRMAQVKGLRSLEEIKTAANICGECAGCKEHMPLIMNVVCGCTGATFEAVADAVKNGADTAEKIGQITKAGTDCGRCKILVENIIAIGR